MCACKLVCLLGKKNNYVGKGLCVRACMHACVCTFELMCTEDDPCKRDACHRQFPFLLLLPPSLGPFSRLDFGFTLICPAAPLSTGRHPVLLTCPHVLLLLSFLTPPGHLFLLVFSPPYFPSPHVIMLLFFLTPTLTFTCF